MNSNRRWACIMASACLWGALATSVSRAGTLYWDGNGSGASGNPPTSGAGGNGAWDAGTTPNWWNGTSYQLWNAAGGQDIADFRGTAGTVSIDGTVNATKLNFLTDGYLLTNGTLHLTGTKSVEVGAGLTTTIGSSITTATAGWTKDGVDGKLILTGNSSFTGWLFVHGILNARSPTALGAVGRGEGVDVRGGAFKGILELEGGIAVGNVPVRFITLANGVLRNVSGTNSLGGLLHYNVDTIIDSQAGLLTLAGGLERGPSLRLLTVQGNGDVLINSGWTNASAMTKNGTGTLTLSGTNRFITGQVLITGGTVLLQGDNSFANMQINSGTADPLSGTRVRVNESFPMTSLWIWPDAALELEDLGGNGLHLTIDTYIEMRGAGINDGGAIRNIAGDNSVTVDSEIRSGAGTMRINSDADTLTVNSDINWTGGTRNWWFGGAGKLVFNGSITGVSSVNKDGSGLVIFTQGNLYTTATMVFDGALRLAHALALPGGTGASGGTGRLDLNGGVAELATGNFERGMGTGLSQFRFLGSGGFSAYGANRHVNIGGASAGVTWAAVNFVPAGSALMLNSAYATAQIDFQNPIALGGAVRTIHVDDNPAVTTDRALISGVISGTAGNGLAKTGTGTLILGADNTYNGLTTVNAGSLLVNGALTGAVTVAGGTLGGTGIVHGTVTVQVSGTITGGGADSVGTLQVGNLTISENATLHYNYTAATQDSIEVLGALSLPASGTLNVSPVGSDPLPESIVLLTFDNGPADGHLTDWTVTGTGAQSYTHLRVLNGQLLLINRPQGSILTIR